MPLKYFRAACATAAAVLVARSAAAHDQGVTVNYDLLVGDISFYNRTMVFALREDEAHGVDMLRLIEDLMAPWTAEVPADDRGTPTPAGDKVLVDVRLVASEWMVRAVIAAAAFGFFLFLLTAVFTAFSFPLTVYYLTAGASATATTAPDAV